MKSKVKCIMPHLQKFVVHRQTVFTRKHINTFCTGSSTDGIYQVWWRLDKICAKKRHTICIHIQEVGLYQSNQLHPRNTQCKYCFDTHHASWLYINIKHMMTNHTMHDAWCYRYNVFIVLSIPHEAAVH